jgi:lipopolysaccharide biosynthesis glycosyltransferase
MKEMAVAYCTDINMRACLHASISSLLRNINPEISPHFHLILEGFAPNDTWLLRQTLDRIRKPYLLTLLPRPPLDSSGFRSLHGNYMPYQRLILPRMIQPERLLYIDSDTVVNLDVGALLDWPMDNQPLAAPLLGRTETLLDGKVRMKHGIPGGSPAFNSGVLLINVSRWNELGVTEECLAFCREYGGDLLTQDQTVLNIKLHGKVQNLPIRFNRTVEPSLPESIDSNNCLVHFVASPKPWDLFGEVIHPQARIYHAAVAETALRFEEQKKYFRVSSWRRARKLIRSYGRSVLGRLRSTRAYQNPVPAPGKH